MFSCTSAEPTRSAGGGGCFCHRPEFQTLTRRINSELSRHGFVTGAGASIAALGVRRRPKAETAPEPPQPILLKNFRLFDGRSPTLQEGLRLFVDDGHVTAVATGDASAQDGAC